MKVLLVSPIPTDPAVAGNRVRIGALFTALVRLGHDVTFGYVPYYDEPADYDKLTQRLGSQFRILPKIPGTFRVMVKYQLKRSLCKCQSSPL